MNSGLLEGQNKLLSAPLPLHSPHSYYSQTKTKVRAESGRELPRVPRGPAAREPQLLQPHLPAARGAHDKLRIPRHAGSPGFSQQSATLPSVFARRPLSSGSVGRSQSQHRSLVYRWYLLHLGLRSVPRAKCPVKRVPRKTKRRRQEFTRAQRGESAASRCRLANRRRRLPG